VDFFYNLGVFYLGFSAFFSSILVDDGGFFMINFAGEFFSVKGKAKKQGEIVKHCLQKIGA
jgi:hypothetical protein